MPPLEIRTALTVTAQRISAQVAALTGRVAVDRAPLGSWSLADGPYGVVSAPVPVTATVRGDGSTLVDGTRIEVSIWQDAATEDPAVLTAVIGALDRWTPAGSGLRCHVEGYGRVPQPEADVLRTALTVRYAQAR